MTITLKKLREILAAIAKDGFFFEDFYFEHAPHVTAKLLEDRNSLEAFALRVANHYKFRKDHPLRVDALKTLEGVGAGWPTESDQE